MSKSTLQVQTENKLIVTLVMLLTFGSVSAQHVYDGGYRGVNLSRIAFPIGGIGAGMLTLEGTGTISHMSIRHHPDMFNEPVLFAALYIKGKGAKVIEGPVPDWKKFGQHDNARGGEGKDYGLARFNTSTFSARFPFGKASLNDDNMPVKVSVTGWSPFIPTDADNSSLPVGALEYTITNTSPKPQSGVFSYNAENFMANDDKAQNRITPTDNGFVLKQDGTASHPEDEGGFAIFTDEQNTSTDLCWFRGGWWDPLTMAWKKISTGDTTSVRAVAQRAPGASLYVPFSLKPGHSKTIKVYLCWYLPCSNLRTGIAADKSSDTTVTPTDGQQPSKNYMPWYASRFKNIDEVMAYWRTNYNQLKHNTQLFTDAFYNSTLPPEVLEAIAANLTILKSPTVMRQYDGRFWGWEGSNDNTGSCSGSCTHVWNYAQALPNLFPSLERSMRETEFGEGLDAFGHQNYREALPIRPEGHSELPAADGQLGGVMRAYRDWRISGDDEWIKKLYPKLQLSLDYCIQTFDPDHTGTTVEPHHNTYDIEFWGADGMCTSIYLGALQAAIQIGQYLHEDVRVYQELLAKGKRAMDTQLYNGKYFIQKVQWQNLHHQPDSSGEDYLSPEAKALLQTEGPKYQYGNGVLSDGVIGAWLARVCQLPDPLDERKVKSHLTAVYQNNFKTDLNNYSNPQRSTYALGYEGGLSLCNWPDHDQPSLPFVYSNEVWTGIEYEVASHLIMEGKVKEGLNIVKTTRKRYDGTIRNPFDEYECGHWYARAMSSYALLQALTGVTYDAGAKTLTVDSRIGDFTSFLSTNTGFGNIIYRNGKATLKVAYGKIDVKTFKELKYTIK